jgi:hypothetical protein
MVGRIAKLGWTSSGEFATLWDILFNLLTSTIDDVEVRSILRCFISLHRLGVWFFCVVLVGLTSSLSLTATGAWAARV